MAVEKGNKTLNVNPLEQLASENWIVDITQRSKTQAMTFFTTIIGKQ